MSSSAILSTFNRFDADGNGSIERSKLSRLLQLLEPDCWDGPKTDNLLASFDTSGAALISYEDFLKWLGLARPMLDVHCLSGDRVQVPWRVDLSMREVRETVAAHLQIEPARVHLLRENTQATQEDVTARADLSAVVGLYGVSLAAVDAKVLGQPRTVHRVGTFGEFENFRLQADGSYTLSNQWSSVNDVYPHDIDTDEIGSYKLRTLETDSIDEVLLLATPEQRTVRDDNCGERTTTRSKPTPWGIVLKKIQDDKYETLRNMNEEEVQTLLQTVM